MKKIAAALSILLFLTAGAFAETKKYVKPKANQVVIAVKVRVTPGINEAFFSGFYEKFSADSKPKNFQEGQVQPSEAVLMSLGGVFSTGDEYIEGVDRVGTAVFPIPKNRRIFLQGFKIEPAGLNFLHFYLPIGLEIVVPEGANYVYIGTLTYEVKGIQYDVVGVKKSDEFDEAAAAVKERYGDAATLVRVPLVEPEPAKK